MIYASVLAACVVGLLLAPPAVASDFRVDDPLLAPTYVANERLGQPSGALPYNWENSPSAHYPPDRTGIPAALDGTATSILSVQWVNRACAYGVRCAEAAASALLERLVGASYIVPGAGQFQAWHGVFQDLNRNGRIDDGNRAFDRVHTSSELDCGGFLGLGEIRTDDAQGLGAGQGVSTGASLRCARADEWQPLHAEIVAYVTPGDWRRADVVNRAFHAWNPLERPKFGLQESPDLAFAHALVDGEATGKFVAPDSSFDLVMVDGSILWAMVTEAIHAPKLVADGGRTHEAGTGSLVDVDLYSGVDPFVAGLYEVSLGWALHEAGCDRARLDGGCRRTTDPFTEPIRKGKDRAFTPLGPAVAAFFPAWERDPQGFDRTSPHVYLDLFVETSASVSLALSEYRSQNGLAAVAPFGNSEISHTGTGRRHASPQIAVMAYFGLWEDASQDGWIGAPTPAPGCPDVHDCGARPNPHRYEDSNGEYVPVCGEHETPGLAPNADGAFPALLAPEGGAWGVTGVYVLSDRKDASEPEADALRDDGRGSYNPYDDAVLDPFGALVTTGPVQVTLTCTSDEPGVYTSYERLVFPFGTNPNYAITVTGATTAAFEALGVPTEEYATDVDRLEAW